MFEVFEIVGDFLDQGGDVLKVIFATTFLLWILIIERFLFFKNRCQGLTDDVQEKWQAREDKDSWFAHKVREYYISKVSSEIRGNIKLIKTLVSLCPLLGLLGTVTGMISVFDVMALTGTGNARLMASGISMATIPTMAGMVTALSGLYFGNLFEGKAKRSIQLLEDHLPLAELEMENA